MKIFRSLFHLSFASFLMGCCAGTVVQADVKTETHPNVTYDSKKQKEKKIESLVLQTVAIVETVGEDSISPSCSGVWVSEGLILTAAHCTQEHSPVFQYVTPDYNVQKNVHIALLLKVDETLDLALLVANPTGRPTHKIATIKKENNILAGDQIDIIGHTSGYPWTYIHGYISSVRSGLHGPENISTDVLQISAPIWMGNSGGGAFDEEGNLVGLCSWVTTAGPNIGFFIHRDAILGFLDRELVKLQF